MNERTAEQITLVGTGHVLEKSVKEVTEVIERERPDVVAVELCETRYRALKGEVQDFSPKELLSSGNPFLLITHWLLAYVQRRMGAEFGIEPGADMLAAITKAEELGIEVALIDRPIQITMQRFWKKMRFWEKLKMLFSIIFSIASVGSEKSEEAGSEGEQQKSIKLGIKGAPETIALDRLTDDDVVTQLMKELRDFSPGAATALLDERDAYIARSLLDLQTQPRVKINQTVSSQPLETWDQTTPRAARRIVAVVGAGHVAGIRNFLSHPDSIPRKDELLAQPKRRLHLSLGNLLGVGLAVAFILIILAVVFMDISTDVLVHAFLWWFFITGTLAAAGVVLARGHPVSVLTAFAVAWLTTLNPFLAAGWFAGLAEAHFRKPTVDDVRGMLNVETIRDLLSNRLFRVILVAALANLGATAGTFIGLYMVGQVVGFDIHAVWLGVKHAFETLFL
jgi:pheromone shutdown protein TraB